MLIENIRTLLSSGWLLTGWLSIALLSCTVLIYDLSRNNTHIPSIMKTVWFMTVLYSGPLGLLIYFYSGRKQISNDSLWRKGFRSVAHCYSGCGAGEVTGVFIAAGLLSLGNMWVTVITFFFAYVFGYGMTLGPLLQDGVPLKKALIDTFYSDTATITVMEVTAVSLDLWLAASATMGQALFWTSLILSLTVGLVAAYPVNVLLVRFGVKGGMGDPRDTSASHQH
jgi:hypothetical protein